MQLMFLGQADLQHVCILFYSNAVGQNVSSFCKLENKSTYVGPSYIFIYSENVNSQHTACSSVSSTNTDWIQGLLLCQSRFGWTLSSSVHSNTQTQGLCLQF